MKKFARLIVNPTEDTKKQRRQEKIEITDDAVGVVCPVYAAEMPMMVREFLSKANIRTDFFFFIYAYGSGYGEAYAHVELAARGAGLKLSYINAVIMVDNYIPIFDMQDQIDTLPQKDVEGQLERICQDIAKRLNGMNTMELIKTRKSVRTFDDRPIDPEDREKLRAYIKAIPNPYDIPVDFVLLDAKEHRLSSPVIQGEELYIAAKVEKQPHGEEAFGFSFEKMALYAWSLGIGTTWIGGTLDRPHFEKVLGVHGRERMYAVTPLGYPAAKKSEVDRKLRGQVKGDERLPASELFFDRTFSTPLPLGDQGLTDILEAVRWAPSAANMQPCRIVKDGDQFHFYERHTKQYDAENYGDVQKLDMGIALCHFMSVTDGRLVLADPGIAIGENMEYIATVRI